MEKLYNVAIVGATGLVGREMVKMLEKHKFPVRNLHLLASARSVGKTINFCGEKIPVEELTKNSFKDIDIALFSAGAKISKEYAPLAAKEGTYVIDNSSAWRMEPDVPLIVPEVNPEQLVKEKRIIANPNCSTIQMVVVLAPLHKKAKIKRIVVATYQAVSGAGQKAVQELKQQIIDINENREISSKVFPYQIAYNCLPQIDVFLPNHYTKEEMKMVNETRKIIGDENINIVATCVRVPVLYGHSEVVNVEFEKEINPQQAFALLSNSAGVVVQDDVEKQIYPMPIYCRDKEETFVGRIREDISLPPNKGLVLWIVSDNLLKGAAFNAVQIAFELIKKKII